MNNNSIQKRLAMAGAILFLIGMVTGIVAAAALTGKVHAGIPHLALAAHLNALLGGLWMIAVAWTFEFLRYDEKGLRRLAIGVSIPAWSNWIVTLIAAFLGVRGLEYTSEKANNVIAVFLQLLVVVPTLIACAFWVWGFRAKKN